MRLRAALTAALVTTLFTASSGLTDDWPGWRGPRGDGISREQQAPLHWSTTENIAWKTPIPGDGRSSPIVVGDHVFITTGIAEDESRHLLCLNRQDGSVQWDRDLLHGPGGQMHRFNSTASSTPICDGQRIFVPVVDDAGMYVFAVTVQGEIAWSQRIGDFFSRHGFAASPVLWNDGVILNGQQDGEAFVVMLDCASGREMWRYSPAVDLRSFSTPVLAEIDQQPLLFLTGSSQTVALNPSNGELVWFATGPSEKFVSTPSVGHGMVFSFGGSPEEKAMAVRLGGAGDVTESHVAWRMDKGMPYVPSPLLVGDFLHIVNDEGIYTCLSPVSGEILKRTRKFGNVYSSPICVGEHIYFFEDAGTCTIIRNGSEFEEIARNDLGELIQTTPAVSEGQLFIRSSQHLFCIGTRTAPVRLSNAPTQAGE
jgi:outer membrane protein assembly factor BamB